MIVGAVPGTIEINVFTTVAGVGNIVMVTSDVITATGVLEFEVGQIVMSEVKTVVL